MRIIFIAMAAIALALLVAGNASACTLRMPRGAETTAVPAGQIDGSLLDAAVRAEVNIHRCRAGLRPLGAAGGSLARAAEAHSRWMVSARNLTHRSNVSGRSTPVERIRSAGVRIRAGSENIGYVSRYQIDGAPFRILDSGNCSFATYGGQPLPEHTYATLARQVVIAWMSSSGHRQNILDRRVSKVATGAVYDRHGPYCGRIWFTQNFVG